MNITKRLVNSEYKRPKITFTDKLTNEDIIDKLEDYEKVEDITKVPIGTHIRYFTMVDGEKKFRLGGTLVRTQGLPKYIVLSNGQFSWSVQMKDVVSIFKKMSIVEIKQEYEDIIEELENTNKNLKLLIMKQKEEIKNLYKKIKN